MQEETRYALANQEKVNKPLELMIGDRNVTWEKLLSSAPMGIAILGQLMAVAANQKDVSIDMHIRKRFELITHSESFRTCILDISTAAQRAFRKAHNNMEKIALLMKRIPTYIDSIVALLNSDNEPKRRTLLSLRLLQIREAEKETERLSGKVTDAFTHLLELIVQVIEAIAISKSQLEHFYDYKINEAFVKSYVRKQMMGLSRISAEEAVQLPENGLKNLRELIGHWAQLTSYFQRINKIIKKATSKKLDDFREEAEEASKDRTLLQFMADSTLQSSQHSYLTYRIADIYVNVSGKYIIDSVALLGKMITASDSTEQALSELMDSCKEACDGITKMVTESKEKLIHDIDQRQTEFEFDKFST